MHYDFDDLEHQDHLAPSDIRPPMNYAEGGMVTAPFTNVLNTQNQMNMMSRPTGSFSGMSSQINTNPPPAVMAQKQVSQGLPRYQPKSYQPDGMPGTPPPAPATQTVQRMNPYDQGAQLSQRPPESFPAQPFQDNKPLFPQPQQPQVVQVDETQQQQPPLAMAKGGSVGAGPERLIAQIRKKFSEQGIDFDKIMAMRLQHMGQKGDTMLAHINPDEAKLLKDHGGSGKTNPHTGLPSFGVDDGPEQGSTGSASGASYGGADTSSSDTSLSDTSSDTSTQAETPTRDRDSYGRESEPYTSPTSDATTATLNLQRASQDAFDFADQQATERDAQQSILGQIGSILGQTIGITPAAAGNAPWSFGKPESTNPPLTDAEKQAALAMMAARRPEQIAREANLAEDQAQAAIDAQNMRSGFSTVPVTYDPTSGYITTSQGKQITNYPSEAAASDIDRAMSEQETTKTIPEIIRDFVNPSGQSLKYEPKYTLPDIGLRIGSAGTPAITTEGKNPFDAVVQAVTSQALSPLAVNALPKAQLAAAVQPSMSNTIASVAPTADVYNYTPPASVMPATDEQKSALIDQARRSQVSSQFTQPSPTEDVYNYTPPVDELIDGTVTATAAPTIAATPKATVSPIAQKMAEQEAARIAALEKGQRFVGGSREQVASALNVDPSQLKARIVLENGQPKVDYYTKSLGEVVGNALSSTGKFISGLTNPPVYNLPRGSYVRDPNAADFFSRTEEPRNYGPYGDLTRAEYRELYGGKDTIIPPLTTTPADTTDTTKPEEKPVVAAPYRKRIYPTVQDLYNYGLTGGEYSFYDYPAAKKGGYISPLKAVKKNG